VVWDAPTGAVSFLLARHGRRSAVRPQVRSGCAVFSVGFVLAIWAITTIRRAGTRVEPNKPTTAIVENGPYRFTRNPIYICMFLGQAGLAMGFNSDGSLPRWRRSISSFALA
jgi:protein-S-isoprenylcysteine O-methyltransferase Ste14